MFLDARHLPEGTVVETDLCIVGGGAAGITLVRELIGQPFRVCLLEGGGLDPDEVTQSLYAAENVGLPYFALDRARARHFGGCTNLWGGWSRPLDELDLQTRPWIPNSGWPIARADLDRYYERAQGVCGLGPFRYDFAYWEDALRALGRRNLPFPRGGLIDFLWQVMPEDRLRFGKVFRSEIETAANIDVYLRANVVEVEADPAAQNVRRLRVACLEGPTFSVAPKIVVLACGGIENARLLLASHRTQAAGLGNQHDLVGRFFMEHPYVRSGRIVLSRPDNFYRSGPPIPIGQTFVAAALGPSRELQEREAIPNFSARFLPIVPEWLEALVRLRRRLSGGKGAAASPSILADLGHVAASPRQIAAAGLAVLSGRSLTERLRNSSYRHYSVHYILEQVPDPESRVRLGPDRDSLGVPRLALDWRLNSQDRQFMRRAQEILEEQFRGTGLGRVHPGTAGQEASWPVLLRESARVFEDLVYRRNALLLPTLLSSQEASSDLLFGSHHHLGTTRMSDDPKKGVVDRHGRVHGVGNLYVAGSSTFPSGGISNPTLTIVALAIRLGDRLKGILSRPERLL